MSRAKPATRAKPVTPRPAGVAAAVTLLLTVACVSPGGPRGPVFDEVSSRVGLAARDSTPRAYGPSWADLDGNGWLDLVYVNHSGQPPSIYLNRGGERFEEFFRASRIPVGSGYKQSGDRHGAGVADFDNDGVLDLIFARGAARGETLGIKFDQLLRGRGDGRFEDVSKAMGALNAQGRARTPTWIDFDRDGWLDLYLGNANSPNVLYRNDAGAGFSDVTAAAGLGLERAYSQGWIDYDLDGRDDVLTMPEPRLFRNAGNGAFVEASAESGLEEIARGKGLQAVAQAWGDFDGDGDPDLFLSAWKPGRSTLLRNQGGRFVEVAGDFGPEERGKGAGAEWADVEGDGDLDLLVLTTLSATLYVNTSRGFVRQPLELAGLEPGNDLDATFADYDRDGRLDLALQSPVANQLARGAGAGGNWLEVELVGERSNRPGFGAQLWAQGRSRSVHRQRGGGSGTLHSSGLAPVRLGLGRAARVELGVRWPSGKNQRFERLRANRWLVVYEGAVRPES